MQRSFFLLFLTALTALGACGESPTINRVGTNVVDKSLFTGSWYYSRMTVDVDYEQAGWGSYQGDAAYDFGDEAGQFGVPRIRWVIDEDALYAYRDYEMVETGDAPAGSEVHHPVAAFPIESHFDIRREYNALTGEERNVLVENDEDRRWYDRDYMRVDWSKNLISQYQGGIGDLYEILGLFNREPADLFIQGQSDFPDSWRPQFNFMTCTGLDDMDCDENERELAEDYEPGEMYHFSFVTQDIISPGEIPDPFSGRMVNFCMSPYSDAPQECTSAKIYVRHAFLRVSESRQYERSYYSDARHERHGFFRIARPTFDRSISPTDPGYGSTDFQNYGASRWNIWREWNDEAGNPIPYADRRVRKLVYHTTTEMPGHLIKPTFRIAAQWNTVIANTVRSLQGDEPASYPPVSCQTEDPHGYCYCLTDNGTVLNPTCNGIYDPFESPAAAEARGATNPYDCYVDSGDVDPDSRRLDITDEDFYPWFESRMVGSECYLEVRPNTCNRAAVAANGGTTEGLECQERGDLRYRFFSYVNQPGTGFLGVATVRSDPVTGEMIACDANAGGPALDSYRTRSLQNVDLVSGDIDERDFILGEDIRSFAENLNNVQPVARPRQNFSVPSSALSDQSEIRHRMEVYAERARSLRGAEGRAQIHSDRLRRLAGTDFERRLMSDDVAMAMAGIANVPAGKDAGDLTEDVLNQISPFRTSARERIQNFEARENAYALRNMLLPNEFTDNAVLEFVNRNADLTRPWLEFALARYLYFGTEVHEFGHCMGLRHQFNGSTDRANYRDGYWYIDAAIPLPDPADFNIDGIAGLSPSEQIAFDDAFQDAKLRRELAGIDRFMGSAVMEYPGNWYEDPEHRVDRYDTAAVSYGYGEIVEIYDNEANLPLEDINPVNTNRIWARYYLGGESCSVDTDCPYSIGGARSGELLENNMTIGATQTCLPDSRGAAFGNVCSNFDEDMNRQVAADPSYVPVRYQFCTDERVGTLANCHRWDEGSSYRQIVENSVEAYERNYVFTHFRRYRRSFGIGTMIGSLLRYLDRFNAITAGLLYEYDANPDYVNQAGDLGFADHFLASADIFNYYARLLAAPPAGSYAYNRSDHFYEWDQDNEYNTDVVGSHLKLPIGMARFLSSEYQSGLSGIERVEITGSFYEKWIAVQLLAERGAANAYSRDVPYWVNIYDLFPVETQDLFRGLLLAEPEIYGARVDCGAGTFPNCEDPSLVFMDYYRGDCSDPATCRASAEERYQDYEIVDTGVGATLQLLGSAFALSEFPVFFDSSFQDETFICVEGSGTCFTPTAEDVEGVTYVRYESPRYGRAFMARKVEAREGMPESVGLGFELLERLSGASDILDILRTYRGDFGGTPMSAANLSAAQNARLAELEYDLPTAARFDDEIDRLDAKIRSLEAFAFQFIELQRALGINGYLGFWQ